MALFILAYNLRNSLQKTNKTLDSRNFLNFWSVKYTKSHVTNNFLHKRTSSRCEAKKISNLQKITKL